MYVQLCSREGQKEAKQDFEEGEEVSVDAGADFQAFI